MNWSWFLCGVGFLLLGSYMDNLRGPLLPIFRDLLGADYEATSYFLVAGNFSALAANLYLMTQLGRISLRRMSQVILVLAVIACATAMFVSTVAHLLVWGGLLGVVFSIFGTLCNLYIQRATSPEIRTRAMSAVHASYGLASFGAPLIAANILQVPNQWGLTYLFCIPLLFLLLISVNRVLPKLELNSHHDASQPIRLESQHWIAIATIMTYVACEVLTSMWMTSWFVAKGDSLAHGAMVMSLFFVMMTGSRLLCSAFVRPHHIGFVLWGSLGLACVFFLLGRLTPYHWLIGLTGIFGPFFPLFVARMTVDFPDRDRTMIVWTLALMQGSLGCLNLLVGRLAAHIDLNRAYWLPFAMLLVCAALLFTNERTRASQASQKSP